MIQPADDPSALFFGILLLHKHLPYGPRMARKVI
jgi:hypothetical protein